MKINLIRLSNSLDPKAPYLKDSENFINDLNNELFDYDIELVNNENRRGFGYKYTIRKDDTGNSYSGFVTDFETETTSNFDEDNDGAAFYIEAMEEYQTSVPVTFTVIFE